MQDIKKIFIIGANYVKAFMLLLLLVAIFSHHSDDPSFSVATNKNPQNILGIYGSYVSDIFVQLFGFIAYLLPFILIINPILFFLNTKFRLKYKFLIFSSIFSLGIFGYFTDQHLGIIGSLLSKSWFSLSEKFFLVVNSIFSTVFLVIFIKINLYEFKNNKDKKKMRKKTLYRNNIMIGAMFANLRDFFSNSWRKIFRSFREKYSMSNLEDLQIHSGGEKLPSIKKDKINTSLDNRRKIIYNPGIRNEARIENQQKIVEKIHLEEKKSSLAKGEVEYHIDGDEVRKTSISYNNNVLHSMPRVFENKKNQKLYEALQLKRLNDSKEEKKVLSDISKLDSEIRQIDEIEKNINDNHDDLNIFSKVNFEEDNGDSDDENDDEFAESSDDNIEKIDYYEREDLLKDLKNNYQKFQSTANNILQKPEQHQDVQPFQEQKLEQKPEQKPEQKQQISELPREISPPRIIEKNNDLERKVSLFRENKVDSKIVNLSKRVYPSFKLPEVDFLSQKKGEKIIVDHHQAKLRAEQLVKVLEDFSVYGRILHYHIGPVITLYEFEPLPGTKSSRVIGLCDDIARSLSAISARISVMPGKNALGIELPNDKRELVLLKEILVSNEYIENDFSLPIALGKNIGGEPVVVDLAKMPHLLVAGTTGAGKSVAINVMILSILYSLRPEECKFIMIDPKMLELSVYNGIPHLLTPVVTDPKKAVVALKWIVKEMESRYRMMSYLGVRNIAGYNEKIEEASFDDDILEKVINIGFDKKTGEPITEKITIEKKKFPYIVVIVDEMADLMLVAGKEIEFYIQRLAQMARAAGIHIIMATQRPSVDVITGVIKANLPTRISFAVTSKIDSRTILGEQGAEQLLGLGDMLYMASGNKVVRIHGPFVSDSEVEKVVQYLQSFGPPNYLEEITNQINLVGDDDEESENTTNDSDEVDEDEFFQQAIELIRKEKKVSISYIQRQLRIGYNKSASIVERMEKEGIVTTPNHQGKRMLVE